MHRTPRYGREKAWETTPQQRNSGQAVARRRPGRRLSGNGILAHPWPEDSLRDSLGDSHLATEFRPSRGPWRWPPVLVANTAVANPALMNPSITNPAITNPARTNPFVTNPAVKNPAVTNPAVTNPALTKCDCNESCRNESCRNESKQL